MNSSITTTDNKQDMNGSSAGRFAQETAAPFSVSFEDRKYSVHDTGRRSPHKWNGQIYIPKEDIYSVDDGVHLARARESVKVLRKGYARRHPVRVLLALLFSPVLTLIGSVLGFFSRFSVCIPCAAASAYAYWAMGEYSRHWAYMDKNAVSTPVSFLFMPLACRLLLSFWNRLTEALSFPVIINDATRDRIIATQEEWIKLIRERMELGKKNDGKFVSMPGIDYYDITSYDADDWLTLYDTGWLSYKASRGEGALSGMSTPPVTVHLSTLSYEPEHEAVAVSWQGAYGGYGAAISDKHITGARTLIAEEMPERSLADLKYLTDESVNLWAGAANFAEGQKAALVNAVLRPYAQHRDAIADSAALMRMKVVDAHMRNVHQNSYAAQTGRTLWEASVTPGGPEAARVFYKAMMEGRADEKAAEVLAAGGGTLAERARAIAGSMPSPQSRWKKGIAEGRKLAVAEFLDDYEKFDGIIRKRQKDGAPSGRADTGARMAESACLVNFIGRAEKALGHRAVLQGSSSDYTFASARARRYAPKVAGTHFWDGAYHTVTDLQMKATLADMRVLRKLGLPPRELKMDDARFEQYVSDKFRNEFDSAMRTGNSALVKSIYRRYSRRYHPDAAPEQFRDRFGTAFRILKEQYEAHGGKG